MALLEQLRCGDTSPRDASSVVRHLNHLLGSSRGFSSVMPEYGVGCDILHGKGMSPEASPVPIERLAAELKRNITCFEPDLVNWKLWPTHRSGSGSVFFRLSGSLRASGAPLELQIAVHLWRRTVRVTEAAT